MYFRATYRQGFDTIMAVDLIGHNMFESTDAHLETLNIPNITELRRAETDTTVSWL